MANILIQNLRHIKNLNFKIPGRGVWLLTGENGTGKTSILGCLRRLAYKNAFPAHFPASRLSDQLDYYEGAKITYDTPEGRVSYTYKTTRWSPNPRNYSHVLSSVGFPEVIYVAANADRIEPRKEDFSPRRVQLAPSSIISGANQIFCSNKFDALRTINLRKGVGSQAFLLELPTGPKQRKRYFSEKNLSLGELCILKLLRMLNNCPQGSLVLIDELELALHPTAQTELLGYLQQISDEKSLTIVVSTHSATIIKRAPRGQVLLLENDGEGNISCTENCFPSYVLGTLAYEEESASDVIIYVEDDAARTIVEQLIRRVIAEKFPLNSLSPSFSVVPVGGIANVLRFFERQIPLLPAVTRAFVVLDADAEEALTNANVDEIVRIYRNRRKRISFLPFVPEEGLAKHLDSELNGIVNNLRSHYSSHTLKLRRQDFDLLPDCKTKNLNESYKRIVSQVCSHLAKQLSNASESDVREILYKLLGEHTFATNRSIILEQFGPILAG